MSRNAEAVLVVAASVLAAIGVAMSGFAAGRWLDSEAALTLLTFLLAFGGLHIAIRLWAPNATPALVPIAAFLSAVGFTEVHRIDPQLAALQRWSFLIGAGAAVLTLRALRNSGVEVLRRYRYIFLALAVGLLFLPLLPDSWLVHGATVNGSRLWVRIEFPFLPRPFSFQPAEMAKVLLTVFLASYLADRADSLARSRRRLGVIQLPEPRNLAPILLAAIAAFGVLIVQRDLGAALLLFALFVGMVYVATGRLSYVVIGMTTVAIAFFASYEMFDHVQRRITGWLDPFADYTGSGYQVVQGLFALGSGSLTGSGIGLGRPDLIPAAATDYVFAAVGEEMGLAGSLAVIVGYALIVTIGFGIALRSRDRFRKYLAAGLTILVGLQAALIIAGVLRLFPVTGITLPFMSYGGSSLLASMITLALLARVSHEERT